jgi:hypothetical protein
MLMPYIVMSFHIFLQPVFFTLEYCNNVQYIYCMLSAPMGRHMCNPGHRPGWNYKKR